MDDDSMPAKVRLSYQLGTNAQPVARWYCVSREGMATLCVDEEDARANAAHCDQAWRAGSPHRAVQLVDAQHYTVPMSDDRVRLLVREELQRLGLLVMRDPMD